MARPPAQAIAVGHFRSTAEAIAAAADAIAQGAAAVELMDHLILGLSRQRLEYAALSEILEGEPDALLFVTFFGETEAEAAAASIAWLPNGARTVTATTPSVRSARPTAQRWSRCARRASGC